MRKRLGAPRIVALLTLEVVALVRCSSQTSDGSTANVPDAASVLDSAATSGSAADSGSIVRDATTISTVGDASADDAARSTDASVEATTDASAASSANDAAENDGSTTIPDAAADSLADTGSADASDGAISLGVDCSPDAGGAISSTGMPYNLACTGLYSSWSTQALAPGVVPYAPGIALWADGAIKSRYILLPAGATIDTSNMDEWTFPVGAKIWKAFTLNGAKVETRFLYKASASGWNWTTYQWSADQTTATELTTGATNVNGTTYEIPDHDKCNTCHQGRIDFVLGFEAIGLSMPAATGLTMSALVAQGRLTTPPTSPLTIPGDANASAALGFLHTNCGNACHNPSPNSLANVTGFYMRLSASALSSVAATDTYQTGVNVMSRFVEPDGGDPLLRIAPGDADASCVTFRDGHRDAYSGEGIQMPPIDTHVVDTSEVQVVATWIDSLDAGTD